MTEKAKPEIAVVGGGIAGLYCARELLGGGSGCAVSLFESGGRVGGRIETESTDMDGFTAEFGPMRFERELQPLFDELCASLDIELDPFPGPLPEPPDDRSADTSASPDGPRSATDAPRLDAFTLLRLGVLRMFDESRDPDAHRYLAARDGWLEDLDLLPTYRPPHWLAAQGRIHTGGLTADELRRTATVPTSKLHMRGTPWRDVGFWNALSEALSHEEILAIRDFGTFYHLIPDNPNAVEWAIFWLRLFQLGDKPLSTITADTGVSTVVDRLVSELERAGNCRLLLRHHLVSLRPADDPARVSLVFRRSGQGSGSTVIQDFDHVILALPQRPLERLSAHLPTRINTQVQSVIGFPLLKAFAVIRDPWWLAETAGRIDERDPATAALMRAGKVPVISHKRAGKIPTREVHYFVNEETKRGMAMLYTDHPASEYWKTLIPADESHSVARVCRTGADVPPLRGALAHYLNFESANERTPHRSVSEDDIVAYAIRDWSREPFGAGCHVWKPGVSSYDVREELKAFALQGAPPRLNNVHICGEAFSEYQGFIEGSLQSALDVLVAMPLPILSEWARG
jgi:hypothetical protein